MSRHQDRVEWQAGWWHNFVDPKDGSFLKWTDAIPGEDVDYFQTQSGGQVKITPKLFSAWVGSFRQNHANMIVEAAQMYRLSGEPGYAQWAASQLDFYANNYHAWENGPDKINLSCLGNQSLGDANLVICYIEAARLLFDWAAPERRQLWYDKLFKPEAELLDGSHQLIHNIAVWQRGAQAQIALLYKDEALWERAVDGKMGFRAQFREGVTSDYFWYEQSMGYTEYVVMASLPLFTFAGLIGQADRLREEAAIAENLMLSTLRIRFPDNTVPNPADSSKIPMAPSPMLGVTYRIFPTHIGLQAAAKRKSWDTLLDIPTPDSAAIKLPEVVSVNLGTSRFALLKKGAWQVFFHYGQITKNHSQAEALNWSASYDGVDFTHDAGTVGYGSPFSREYYQTGLSHNVPLINGEGQVPWNPGKLLAFDAEKSVMAAEQPSYRPNASAQRTLRIEGESLVDEATIRSADTKPEQSKLGLALHLQGTPRFSSQFHAVQDFEKGRPKSFHYWTNVQAATFRDKAEVQVEFPGGRMVNVTFSTPGEFTLYQGSSPDIPPKHRAGFYLEKSGTTATFITTFTPGKLSIP